jgi:hypothetical protein
MAGWIQVEGSVICGVQTKFEPLLLVHLAHYKAVKNILKLKVTGPQNRGGQKLKKTNRQTLQSQFPNTQKIHYMLLCCS